MLSIPDMALLGAAALLLFGPEQLPRVARKAGGVMREIQNTSQSFIREMERAADLQDAAAKPYEPPPYDPVPYDAAAYAGTADDEIPVGEKLAEPRSAAGAETAAAAEDLGTPSYTAEPAPEPDHPAHL